MKQLNLLPTSVKDGAYRQRLLSGICAVGGLALLSVGLLYLAVHAQVTGAQQNEEQREQLAAAAAQKVAEQQKEFVVSPDLTNRVTQINTLSKNDVNWTKAFSLVQSILPKDVTLGSYSLASAPSGLVLKMGGQAPSNVSFASFVESLQSSSLISNPKVDGYSYTPGKGTVNFSISASIAFSSVAYVTTP